MRAYWSLFKERICKLEYFSRWAFFLGLKAFLFLMAMSLLSFLFMRLTGAPPFERTMLHHFASWFFTCGMEFITISIIVCLFSDGAVKTSQKE